MSQQLLQDDLSYCPLNLVHIPDPHKSLFCQVPLALMRETEETLTTLTKPTRQQRQAKIAFWEEYRSHEEFFTSHQTILQVEFSKVLKGICSQGLFSEWVSRLNFRAWFITPQVPEPVLVSELLYQGLENLKGILSTSPVDDEGKPLTTLINTQLSIVKMLDSRKYGAPVQRIEQKTQVVAPVKQQSEENLPLLSVEEMLTKIQELERKLLPSSR